MTTPDTSPQAWADRLIELGQAVRQAVDQARAGGADLAVPVAQEGGDTIFAIDRHVEPVLERVIDSWPSRCKPLLLIAEGFGADGRKRFGPADQPLRYRMIVDPIDGTRNIMYDKRAAWMLAAVVEDRGEQTTLDHAIASTIVELPVSKAAYGDIFAATRHDQPIARRVHLGDGLVRDLSVRSSSAPTLFGGFAQVSNFFPGTKVLASQLMERIVAQTLGQVQPGSAAVFEDQYITTGGQMVELMLGHDRFCCDLRPLLYAIIEKQTGAKVRGLLCHPYDMAGLLVAQRFGVILTDGLGAPLTPPLDVHSPVHWCGYANETLRQQIEPVIRQFFVEQGIVD
jgi:fructose-1,6-bisphosphatase/inositol monophosphatase family enzyme